MKRLRVLVIDDSAFNRRTITKILEELPEIEVVGYAVNGEEGIRRIIDLKPDLVTLDLEMPVMDGFTLLRIIMSTCPTPVIIVSAQSDDERVFRALELGAVDFVAKPGNTLSVELLNIRDDLQVKVRSVLSLNLERFRRQSSSLSRRLEEPEVSGAVARSVEAGEVAVVAIGASTGGPPALQTILAAMPAAMSCSFLVAQHMPAGFTKAFAERLDRSCALTVREARDGERIRSGVVLIAPGGYNMICDSCGGEPIVRVVEPAADCRYIPSVDALFVSLAEHFGHRLLAAILTGMGNDGSSGVKAVRAAGGAILAEAEESAVIYGMPREAIATGLVEKVVPIEQMAGEILRRCSRKTAT